MNGSVRRGEVRLRKHLELACKRIGTLAIEEAFWIFIPSDRSQKVRWQPAVKQDNRILSSIRLPGCVIYLPTPEDVRDLLESARRCDWVVHVHNHPLEPYPGVVGSISPSESDFRFAYSWRVRLSEVDDRLRFFVVQGDQSVEYAPNPEKPSAQLRTHD